VHNSALQTRLQIFICHEEATYFGFPTPDCPNSWAEFYTMRTMNILTAVSLAIAVSLLGLTATATPTSAHPCFKASGTFTCLEDDAGETFVCVGTYDDDNSNGGYDHGEEDTFACSNGQT
jgi:hypothetical protein